MRRVPVLLTRPAEANAAFLDSLGPETRARIEVTENPLLEIVGLPETASAPTFEAAIFTSANGVRFAPEGLGRAAYCVGTRTAAAARARGWEAAALGEDAEALVAALIAQPPGGTLIHFRGVHQRGDVVARLRAAGREAAALCVYDQRLLHLSQAARALLSGESIVLVPLFSPRVAARFALDAAGSRAALCIAMSAAVAEPLAKLGGYPVRIADAKTGRGMAEALEKAVHDCALG